MVAGALSARGGTAKGRGICVFVAIELALLTLSTDLYFSGILARLRVYISNSVPLGGQQLNDQSRRHLRHRFVRPVSAR